jgi:hypothetical protein
MARPRIDDFFVNQIKGYTQNRPDLRASAIRRLLLNTPRPADIGNVPDERTIRRVMNSFRPQPESERKTFDWFRWPESMEPNGIPWQSSRTCLDLLNYCVNNEWARPTVNVVVWFVRVSEAIPGSEIPYRLEIAQELSRQEQEGFSIKGSGTVRAIEGNLARERWREPRPEPPPEFETHSGVVFQKWGWIPVPEPQPQLAKTGRKRKR